MKILRFTGWAALLIHSAPAIAGLGAPTGVSSSSVLPAGVGSPRFITAFGSYTQDLDDHGNVEGVGHDLNKTIRWKDVLLVQKTEEDKTTLRNVIQGKGFGELDSPGFSTGEVNVAAIGFVPTFAYGVTERFTLGFALPIVTVDVSTATGFVKNQDAQTVIDQICASSTPVRCNEIKNQFATAVDQMTEYYKFDPVRPQHTTKVGDARVIGKYSLWRQSNQSIGISGDLTIPTGTPPNADKLIDVSTGDGDWGVGATLAYDAKRILDDYAVSPLLRDIGFGVYGGYTAKLPDKIVKRIPEDGQLLPHDKEEVSRDLGDRIALGTGLNYELPTTGLAFSAGYHFQYLTQTHYSGSLYSPDRYRQLEGKDPLAVLNSLSFSAGFSTVGFYRKKVFPVPMEANLSYGKVLAGRNIADADRISGELVLFF